MSIFQSLVGIDLGAHGIKAAWLDLRAGHVSVQRTEQLILPSNPAEAERLTASWIERLDLNRQPCAIALGGAQTVFQPGRLTPEDPRTPGQAAIMEVATFNDLAGDQMMHDVTAFEPHPGLRQYLITMARPAFVERALESASRHGLRVVDLMPAPVALFNWQERETAARKQPRLYVHVGHAQTEIAIGVPGGLLFARSVAMGGSAFTAAIAQARQVTTVQAESLKIAEAGLSADHALSEALLPVADRWTAQITSALAVYKSQFNTEDFTIECLVLSGGGARLKGLPEHIEARLSLPLSPPTGDAGGAPPGFELACGLAATALGAAPIRISLLPRRLRNEVIFGVKKPYWIATAICGALTLGVFTISGLRGLGRENEALRREGRELRQRERTARNIEQQRRRQEQIRHNSLPLGQMLLSAPLTRDLVGLVARSIDPNDWISMICDERSYTRPPTERDAERQPGRRLPGMRDLGARRAPEPVRRTSPAVDPMRTFIVEGYTPDPSLQTVKTLIARLQRPQKDENLAGLLTHVNVKADLLADDRVLAPQWLGNTTPPTTLTNLTRFVVRVELQDP